MQALTPAAESALVDHIRLSAYSGYPLTPAQIREYANAVSRRIGQTGPVDVGRNWLQGFLLRHPSIRPYWSRCPDNVRLTGTTEEDVRQWFHRLGEIMREYSVASTDVFNMDETGFMFGLGASERVVVSTGDLASRFSAQPGTRGSASVIECIGSGGQVLPPLIITKGKHRTVGEQRRMNGIPASWHLSESDSGCINSELAVEWVENILDPHTRPSTPSHWRLLIIDDHQSHTSKPFCDALWSHRIIPFVLPPHTTHVMQPLEVSIFSRLTSAYRRLVSSAAESVGATIDKAQFASFYAHARETVLTQSAARKAFSDLDISVNPDPHKVLCRLALQSTPSEASRMPLQAISIPRSESAFNAALDAALAAHAQDPNSRVARDLKEITKQAYETAQASHAILEAEKTMLLAHQ